MSHVFGLLDVLKRCMRAIGGKKNAKKMKLRGRMQTQNWEGMISHKGEHNPSSYHIERTVSHSIACTPLKGKQKAKK
ncbi:hypothetical protein VIGAN_04198300 [Vigna angularis var. angularis]|uniref:Uncharacterized protein n=1 Tax=Vigna angularis var. angularis TaxID=157739 RepID=A0A0S3RVC2_PHAAN|nr:hypothetical protein VIGAN_04198300 [Vigna angularis var. angularis]